MSAKQPIPGSDTCAESGATTPKPQLPEYVVGLGASAGGLEALRALFAGLSNIQRLSFVVVQHLAPQHRSRLVELIAHETQLPVTEVEDGAVPRPGVIHITPPNADVVLEDGRLRLRDPAPKIGPKPSVDLFLTSLAAQMGERGIAVVLSGTGSDGAHGVRAIKAAGGLTFTQSLKSSKYDGMPRAAMQTGAVDRTLTPAEIAEELCKIDTEDGERAAYLRRETQPLEGESLDPADPFARLISHLQGRTGVDLSGYKPSTIRRRIERRMSATGVQTVEDYADYLAHTPSEAQLLLSDILISVTSFFRDAEAFKALRQWIESRVRGKYNGESFRCWVAGCATGEEAYSIAILINEAMEKAGKRIRVQIFATDLDEQALLIARKASYSKASLVDVPESLTERYFSAVDDRLQVASEIREMVVFAKHNMAEDPPFLNLDLVSCRNVLIYFANALQERVLSTFHYSLASDGVLFLGKSETAGAPAGCFEPVDKQAKLYQRIGRARDLPLMRSRREWQREATLTAQDRQGIAGLDSFYSLIAAVAPDAVLVDEDGQVRQVFGNAGEYLRLPAGEATTDLSKLLPPNSALGLGTLLHRAGRSGRAVRGPRHEIELPGRGVIDLQLQVIPITHSGQDDYLVGFEQFPVDSRLRVATELDESEPEGPRKDKLARLEAEVVALREHLQRTIEEHETANEELQALNEEMQSTNEELQSANEELETTNEELQSSNEELTTVNQELNVKSAELQTLNQRLAAIQSAISYPLLIVDRELRLRNFNPASRYLFRVTENDLGSSLKGVPAYVDIARVAELLERALAEDKDQTLELSTQGRHFEVKVQIFRDSARKPGGAVISFVEITELRDALESAELNQRQIRAITENTPALISMKDSQGVYTYANSRFCELAGRPLEQIQGRTDEELFGPAAGAAIREHDFEVLKQRRAVQGEEQLELGGSRRAWLASRFPLLDAQNKAYSLCTVALDITEREHRQRELELFRSVLSGATDGIAIFEQPRADADPALVYCSGLLLAERGLETGQAQGMAPGGLVQALLPEGATPEPAAVTREILAELQTCITYCVGGRGEDERWVELRSTRLPAQDGQPGHLVLLVNEVTQQVRNEKTLQEQKDALGRFSRLAALGEVAAGISHEIGTPLNAITTKTELLRRMVESGRIEPERMGKTTRDIDRMVENIDQVIAGLKSVSRLAGKSGRRQVTVQTLIEDTLRVVGFSLRRSGVPVQLALPEAPLEVCCNPVQICQILVNLLNNALDAIAAGASPWVRIEARDADENCVHIDVIDSGDGIPADIAERIMTPFFTTKSSEQGTGLGLSLSRSIARRHGGELELCRNAANTTFRLTLPKRPTQPNDEEAA